MTPGKSEWLSWINKASKSAGMDWMVTFCKDDKLGMENYGAVILWSGFILLIPSTIAELVEFTSFWIEVRMMFRKLVTKSDIYRFSSELMKCNVWGAVYLLNSSNKD